MDRYNEIQTRGNGTEARDKNSSCHCKNVPVCVCAGIRRVESPARIHATRNNRPNREYPPIMNKYQLAKLSRGKATSRAPIINGRRKLPRTVGIEGMRKNQTITTPCRVNSLLYTAEVTRSPFGVSSSSRISVAATPPMKKKRYRNQVKKPDTLMVCGQQPRAQRVTGGKIVFHWFDLERQHLRLSDHRAFLSLSPEDFK